MIMNLHTIYVPATSESGDYEQTYALLTFPSGSSYGVEMCAHMIVHSDNLVEFEENFTVVQALVTQGSSFILGNNRTAIALTDNDGIH